MATLMRQQPATLRRRIVATLLALGLIAILLGASKIAAAATFTAAQHVLLHSDFDGCMG